MNPSDTTLPAAIFDRATWTPLLELSTREVFEIMLGTRLALRQQAGEPRGEFTALVGLAGSLCGILSIRCNNQAARMMAGKMLGLVPDEVDNDLRDALGEIANMIAGNFKGKLIGVGNRCILSVPTIIFGSDYGSRSLMAAHVIEVFFELEKRAVCVTLELHQ